MMRTKFLARWGVVGFIVGTLLRLPVAGLREALTWGVIIGGGALLAATLGIVADWYCTKYPAQQEKQ